MTLTAPPSPITETWPTAYPSNRGLWTLKNRDGSWGSFDPDTGESAVVDPADDPGLPGLRDALELGPLVGYRVGRRAVVATPTSYVKVVRPKRHAALVSTHQWLSKGCPGVATPEVTRVTLDGVLELATVPGVPLHELIRKHGPEQLPLGHIDEVAAALVTLHSTPLLRALPQRNPNDSTTLIATVARVAPAFADDLAAKAELLPKVPAVPDAVIHGDLHDKNIFYKPGRIGLIDLDGIGVSAPEDDIANLAVHLQLRALQTSYPNAAGDRLANRLLSSYQSHRPLNADRVHAATAHTWFRLACLYNFRNTSRRLVPELLQRATKVGP